MLRNTFIHIPGITPATERKLWSQGIRTWSDYMRQSEPPEGLSTRTAAQISRHLEASHRAFVAGDAGFFQRIGEYGETWRAFGDFPSRCAYVDIETTGLSRQHDQITIIGVYDGARYQAFVRGKNLEKARAELARYKVLVTFNGLRFDAPFLEEGLRGCRLPPLHIDLLPLTRRLGYRGGLKKIERAMGIRRGDAVDGMDGDDALLLWAQYEQGSRDALERLIEYNQEDVCNLEAILKLSFERLRNEMQVHIEE